MRAGPGNGVDEIPLPEWTDDVFRDEAAVRVFGNPEVLAFVRDVHKAESDAYRLFDRWNAVNNMPVHVRTGTLGEDQDSGVMLSLI